jgi:hypothetical protein
MPKPSKAVSAEFKFQNQDFDLFQAIEAVDRKNYDWYSCLTEEQQRKFVPYMMLHWISAVKGNLDGYYLLSTDIHANKYMFNERVQHHPELQWLMLCASSPGRGKQFHQWIPHLSEKVGSLREPVNTKTVSEYFAKIYPGADKQAVTEAAEEFTQQQNHKQRLAAIFPDMKLADIEILSQMVSKQDIEQYEQDSGG